MLRRSALPQRALATRLTGLTWRADYRQGGMADGVPGQQWVSMPEFFVKHNFTTLGHGKLYQ